MKILLADDMGAFLDLERSFLSRADCEIYTAGTGVEALKLAARLHPDLILLDIEMPEMTGIEACRMIKSTPATSHIPVVIITASEREEEARNAGADDFVKKPVDEPGFLEVVKKFIRIKMRHDLRVPYGGGVRLREAGRERVGQARDLSVSGMAIMIEPPPPIGMPLDLAFQMPIGGAWQTVQTHAVVVRQITGGFAVRFVDPAPALAAQLDHYVHRH